MNVYYRLLLVLVVICPISLFPSGILLFLNRKDLPYSIFVVKALPEKPNFYLEFFRWSIFSFCVAFTFSLILLIYKSILNFVQSPANYSKIYSVRRFFLLGVFIVLIHGFGCLFLFQSTLTLGNLDKTFKAVLVNNFEKILLIAFMISSTISIVKYLMAVIRNNRYEKHWKKRIEKCQQQSILLGNLTKSCNLILKRKRSHASLSMHEKTKEFEKAKDAFEYIERKNPERVAKIIFKGLVQRNETQVKESDLKICFPGLEASEAFSVLKMSLKSQGPESDGEVSEQVILGSISLIIEEYRNLEENQRSFKRLAQKLEIFFLIFFLTVTILVSLFLVTMEGASFGWQLLALLTSLSYMTEDTLSRMVKCLIFAFINYPFDIGDQIIFEGKTWTVLKIEFFAMQAIANETKYTTDIPISNISGSKIVNLSRSERLENKN
jgi:hypothetical protein